MKKSIKIILAMIGLTAIASASFLIDYASDNASEQANDKTIAGLFETPDAHSSGGINISYPQNGTIFPPEIASPTFHWTDSVSGADTWKIMIGFADADKNTPYIS
ncbi:MAG: hypothetical protein KAH48_06480, partial [Chlorobi bacterium]|nr:hypothetical protein [Chlorobiota bacterium]